jgi:hypothetical protein
MDVLVVEKAFEIATLVQVKKDTPDSGTTQYFSGFKVSSCCSLERIRANLLVRITIW